MKKTKTLFAALILLLTSYGLYAQDISGKWHGLLKVQGTELRIDFNLNKEGEALKATLDSPDQKAFGIPVSKASFEDSQLFLELTALGAQYEGELFSKDSISGTFTQRGMSFPLNLSRKEIAKTLVKRPQEPVKPYPYKEEFVSFKGGGDFELAGTLTTPFNSTKGAPLVILITGSGPQNRDEEFMGHKPFFVLADQLTRAGISVLRYDDRGTGESGGSFHQSTSLDFAKDAAAAVEFVKSRPDLSHSKIGLAGHSEGGLIAPVTTTYTDEVDFLVLMAGPGVSGKEILLDQTELIGKTSGLSQTDLEVETAFAKKIFNVAETYKDMSQRKEELSRLFKEELKARPDIKPAKMSEEEFLNAQLPQFLSPWWSYFIFHEPKEYLKKVAVPVLAINGSMDVQVPAERNLKAIEHALQDGGNKQVTIKEFKGLNHLFQECETGAMSEYEKIDQTMSPEVMKYMTEWMLNLK